jgi:hypothetical protein
MMLRGPILTSITLYRFFINLGIAVEDVSDDLVSGLNHILGD